MDIPNGWELQREFEEYDRHREEWDALTEEECAKREREERWEEERQINDACRQEMRKMTGWW